MPGVAPFPIGSDANGWAVPDPTRKTTAVDETTFTDTTVKPLTRYQYQVFAANDMGASQTNGGYVEASAGTVDLVLDGLAEERIGSPNEHHAGAFIGVNEYNRDGDRIIDFADGYNLTDSSEDDIGTANNGFKPITLTVPAGTDVFAARFRIAYDASDPALVQVSGTAAARSYVLPVSGTLRLWTKNGTVLRDKRSVSQGGDYIVPGAEYTASELGITGVQPTATLYLEAVKPSGDVGDRSIVSSVDPDGAGTTFGYELTDEVRLAALAFEYMTQDPVSGDVYRSEDVLHPSLPKPEVMLKVNSAVINSQGNLVVNVTWTVKDLLSGLAERAAERLKSLTFTANGRQIGVVNDLPALSTAAASMPWQPHALLAGATQTLTISPFADPGDGGYRSWGGDAIVIRAVTSPNGAGNKGWDQSAIVLDWRPASEFSQGTGGNVAGVGAIAVGPDVSHLSVYYPVIDRIVPLGGSQDGTFQPTLARTNGFGHHSLEQVKLLQNDTVQKTAPFTYSPVKQYVVHRNAVSTRPKIYLVTVDSLDGSLVNVLPDDMPLGQPGQKLKFDLKDRNGQVIAHADALALEDMPKLEQGSEPAEGGPVTDALLLTYFKLLYGEEGLRILRYFQNGGNRFELGDVFGDFDIDWIDETAETVVVQIEEDITPVQAAQYLYVGLKESLGYASVQNAIPAYPDPTEYLEAFAAARLRALAAAAACAEVYLSGLTILSEGADWVMTAKEVSEGNYAAAVGFLPFISASMVSLGASKLTVKFGTKAVDFTTEIVTAIEKALVVPDLVGRHKALVANLPAGTVLTADLADVLVKGKFLEVSQNYGALRKSMLPEPPGFMRPQVHHELPWGMKEEFAMRGLDVSAKTYRRLNGTEVPLGRWVEGSGKLMPGDPSAAHQSWSRQFNAEWKAFFDGEELFSNGRMYTPEEIIDKMLLMRSSEIYRSR